MVSYWVLGLREEMCRTPFKIFYTEKDLYFVSNEFILLWQLLSMPDNPWWETLLPP